MTKSLFKHIEVFAVTLSLLGTWLVTCKDRYGFLCWAIANLYWVYDSYRNEKFSRALMWVVYWVMAIFGFMSWK